MSKKVTVKDLREVRFKLAEKWADFENGDLSAADSKIHIGYAGTIINSCKVEVINNHFKGLVGAIDFIDYEKQKPNITNGITKEILDK